MSKTNAKFRNGEYDGLETSDEILEAIEDIADVEWDLNAGPEHPCYRIWSDPSDGEYDAVIAAAWTYADTDETELYWGGKIPRA